MQNLLSWCDNKITYLKSKKVRFENNVPVIPSECIFDGIPKNISTYEHRNSIPKEFRSESLLSFFIPDNVIFNRLHKIETDLQIFKQYGGICGLDLSPSIYMLLPRQRMSILINAVFNCYCAIQGIKVLPNARLGELSTMSMVSSIPCGSNIISSNLGCRQKDLKFYDLYQLSLTILSRRPSIVFIYGNILKSEAEYLFNTYLKFRLIVFPDVRRYQRNHNVPFEFVLSSHGIEKIPFYTTKEGD